MENILHIVIIILIMLTTIKYKYTKKNKNYLKLLYLLIIKKIILLINNLSTLLAISNNYFHKKLAPNAEFQSLSPKDDLQKENAYIQAIKESIDDIKRKNIALTGIYGSGKSSVIESFKKNYLEYRYLDISLATFLNTNESSLEEELEKNILNQIFYKIEINKIPYSRFRKINNINRRHILNILIFLILLIVTSLILISPDLITILIENSKLFEEKFIQVPILKNYAADIVLITFFITLILILYSLIKLILNKVTINAVQTKNLNIQFNSNDNSSTFNKYLDEIMYFFETEKYNVVFFEDLDRFNNLEIFIKLRNLNILLNNSEAIKHKITFIYAIKDEIFYINKVSNSNSQDSTYEYIKDSTRSLVRTKFFDFIIPIMPVINHENSYKLLNDNIQSFNKHYGNEENRISQSLLKDVSFFINDMRLLTNIYNEFLIYYKKLVLCNFQNNKETLNLDKLFAIIVYKNLYPDDFTKLQNRDGMLYTVFHDKDIILQSALEDFYSEIETYKSNIEQLKKEIFLNVEELYTFYEIFWKKSSIYELKYTGISSYVSITDLKDLENVNKFKKQNTIPYRRGQGYEIYSIDFDNLMTLDGSKDSYYDRLIAIHSKGNSIEEKIKYNQTKIEILINKTQQLKQSSVKKLINDERFYNALNSDLKNAPLIIRLIQYGYIDEMYSYYISHFYEGKLTLKDFEFVQSVMHNKTLNSKFNLTNIDEVINHLRFEDFYSPYVLNYTLIEYLSLNLKVGHNRKKLDKIIKFLSTYLNEYLKFIVEFITLTPAPNITNFIIALSEEIDYFWDYIYINNDISLEEKDLIILSILKHNTIETILRQDNKGNVKHYIESNPSFISLITNQISLEKLSKILETLNIKIKDIDNQIISKIVNFEIFNTDLLETFNCIYKTNSYEINYLVIEKILQILAPNKNSNLNYSNIQNSNHTDLVNYINQNITTYIENIFIHPSIQDTNKTIIDFLNNKHLKSEFIIEIIKSKKFMISDITQIQNYNIWELLFKNFKVDCLWKNILSYYYFRESIDSILADFINSKNIAYNLSLKKLYTKEQSVEKNEKIDGFVEDLIKSNLIKNDTISVISYQLGYPFTTFECDGLSDGRIRLLINKNLLALTNDIYSSLKNSHPGLHIYFLEENITHLIEEKTISLESEDIESLIKSKRISNEYKYEITKSYFNNIHMTDVLAKKLYTILDSILDDKNLDYLLIESLLKTKLSPKNKIRLLTSQIKWLDIQEIKILLEYIEETYSQLLEPSRKRFKLDNTEENILLLNSLKANEYISSFNPNENPLKVVRKYPR